MRMELNACCADQNSVPFWANPVDGKLIRIDPADKQEIAVWLRPMNQKAIPQLVGLWTFFRWLIPRYAQMVAPIIAVCIGNGKCCHFWQAPKTAFQMIIIMLARVKTKMLQPFNSDRLALVETDASDFTFEVLICQQLEYGKIHP